LQQTLGAVAGDALDRRGRSRFHVCNPQSHITGKYPYWYMGQDWINGNVSREVIYLFSSILFCFFSSILVCYFQNSSSYFQNSSSYFQNSSSYFQNWGGLPKMGCFFYKCHDSFIILLIYISNDIYLKRVLSWVSKYVFLDLVFIFKKEAKLEVW